MSKDLLHRPLRETWKWWSALIVAPVLWGARLLAGWAIAEIACAQGWAPSTGYYAIETAILALAIVPIALTGLAAGSALRGSAGGVEVDPVEVYPFLAITSVLSAVIFGSLVIVEALTVYVVTC